MVLSPPFNTYTHAPRKLAPNPMVLSPPFKGLTRLRFRAGDARADRLAAGAAK